MKTQQSVPHRQPIYQQPRYVPPTPAKKKSIAPLIIGGIAGLCVIAIIITAISTNLIGFSNDRSDTGNHIQTIRPVLPETPAGETDSNGHQGTPLL